MRLVPPDSHNAGSSDSLCDFRKFVNFRMPTLKVKINGRGHAGKDGGRGREVDFSTINMKENVPAELCLLIKRTFY
jgi:hypothetical protein